MIRVTEHDATLDGEPVFWLQGEGAGDGAVPVLYVHGVPTSADDWPAFLQRTGGLAPDLPGFGRSGKRGDGDYTMHRYASWLERFLEDRGVDRFSLVVHDWGGIGLVLAQRFPERVERLVVMNAVPLLPGYRWHRLARVWRTRILGELFMGSVSRFTIKQLTRESNATKGPMPDAWLDHVIAHFDQGTQRAILRLYRSADPEDLAAAGAQLGTLTCPTLVLWGDRDPYIPASFADVYAAAIPGAELVRLPDAGHWPWLDRPDAVDTVAAFLAAGVPPTGG
ncbi:MAG: alpha/beta hydrolase [Solirubrobacterales bacterium]|nr:alpha/beta hydrolase [Solirubrobacterales bacterium]